MIYEFQNENRFLSNFYECPVRYMGLDWSSSENAYQASKFPPSHHEMIRNMTPCQAKRYGKDNELEIRVDFNKDRVKIMRMIVFCKFSQNPDLKKKLLDTGVQHIQEGNTWNDRFWGVSPVINGTGSNYLGIILMDVRDELRSDDLMGL